MLRKLLFIVVACVMALLSYADVKLPPKVEAGMPKDIESTIITKATTQNISKIKSNKYESTNKYWKALVDRANAVTYKGPSASSGEYKKLNFNAKVNIAKIENGFALIYDEPSKESFYPEISKYAESLGWIPMNNLLLWSFCPVDSRGIYEKALITLNLDELSVDNYMQTKDKLMKAFLTPGVMSTETPISTDQIYFVMKDDGEYALLANNYNVDGTISSANLVGWVSKKSFQQWNQRSCLEPTWDKRAINTELDGVRVDICKDAKLKDKRSYITFDKENVNRIDGEMFRFPILNNDSGDNSVYHCTIFGGEGDYRKAAEAKRTLSKHVDNFISNMRQLNLIIVIDGTTSMQPFYKEVKNAIKESLQFFDENLRVGVVIYRDKMDGPAAVEYLPLTNPGNPQLAEFLDNGGKYGVGSSPNDKTQEEDMFLGLETALDMNKMGYKKGQSNVMLLVGDCGNIPDDQRLQAITNRMVENDIQLMAYQTNLRNTSGAYQQFCVQAMRMIKGNMDGQNKVVKGKWAEMKDNTGNFYQQDEVQNQIYMGVYRKPAKEGSLAVKELQNMIVDNLQKFSNVVQNRQDIAVNPNWYNDKNSTVARLNTAFLEKIDPQLAHDLKAFNTSFAYEGFVPKTSQAGIEYWMPVVFISKDELASLLSRLQPAYEVARKSSDDRKPYVQALEGIVKAMDPTAQTGDTDLGKITALVAGLNVQTQATGDNSYTLNQLMDHKAVSEEKYRSILSKYKSKYEKLKEIQRSKYQYIKDFNGSVYYWIPVEDLP